MDRMKTLLKYALWIVLFFIFSEIMIKLSIETTYKDIQRKGNLNQISIYQAQATKVNGRIKGKIYNSAENKIKNKYIKIDLYSARNIYLGSRYIDVSSIGDEEEKDFEIYFKVQDVNYYEMNFTDEKVEGELPEILQDLTKEEVVLATLLALIMFW